MPLYKDLDYTYDFTYLRPRGSETNQSLMHNQANLCMIMHATDSILFRSLRLVIPAPCKISA